MISIPQLLARAELLLAFIAILSALKSAYNGTLRELIENMRMIPNIENKVDEVEGKQEEMQAKQGAMVDALVALSYSQQYDDVEVPPERMREELLDDDGPSRFTDSKETFVRGGKEASDD
jgi:ABC-type multidrug transport system ATPase subunit